jgi:hypothetical protein
VIHHYYHLYAAGEWREAVAEHIDALISSGLSGQIDSIRVGVVGPEYDSLRALEYVAGFIPTKIAAAASDGWENVTLGALRRNLGDMDDDDVVLYAHTKGSAARSELNDEWRRSMTYWNITRWHDAVTALKDHDSYGCMWVTDGPTSFWGGNFWWATAGYLRTLDEVDTTSRYHSEIWIGSKAPSTFDANPGFPSMGLVMAR